MVDDNEEFNLLSTYLSLNNNHEEASCFLPDELQDVLNFFTSVD